MIERKARNYSKCQLEIVLRQMSNIFAQPTVYVEKLMRRQLHLLLQCYGKRLVKIYCKMSTEAIIHSSAE